MSSHLINGISEANGEWSDRPPQTTQVSRSSFSSSMSRVFFALATTKHHPYDKILIWKFTNEQFNNFKQRCGKYNKLAGRVKNPKPGQLQCNLTSLPVDPRIINYVVQCASNNVAINVDASNCSADNLFKTYFDIYMVTSNLLLKDKKYFREMIIALFDKCGNLEQMRFLEYMISKKLRSPRGDYGLIYELFFKWRRSDKLVSAEPHTCERIQSIFKWIMDNRGLNPIQSGSFLIGPIKSISNIQSMAEHYYSNLENLTFINYNDPSFGLNNDLCEIFSTLQELGSTFTAKIKKICFWQCASDGGIKQDLGEVFPNLEEVWLENHMMDFRDQFLCFPALKYIVQFADACAPNDIPGHVQKVFAKGADGTSFETTDAGFLEETSWVGTGLN